MSGLFRRLSGRRSAGPEGDEPQTAAEPGATDASAQTPADERGHRSLLTDPATGYLPTGDAPTNVMSGDPRAQRTQDPAGGDPLGPSEGRGAEPSAHDSARALDPHGAAAGDPLTTAQRAGAGDPGDPAAGDSLAASQGTAGRDPHGPASFGDSLAAPGGSAAGDAGGRA